MGFSSYSASNKLILVIVAFILNINYNKFNMKFIHAIYILSKQLHPMLLMPLVLYDYHNNIDNNLCIVYSSHNVRCILVPHK